MSKLVLVFLIAGISTMRKILVFRKCVAAGCEVVKLTSAPETDNSGS